MKNLVTLGAHNTSQYSINCSINYELSDSTVEHMVFLDIFKEAYESDLISKNYFEESALGIIDSIPKINTDLKNFKKFILKEVLLVSFYHSEKTKKLAKTIRDNGSKRKPQNINALAFALVNIFLSSSLFFNENELDSQSSRVSNYFKNIKHKKEAVSEVVNYFNKFGIKLKKKNVQDIYNRRKQFNLKFKSSPQYFMKFRYFPEFIVNTGDDFAKFFS